MAYGKKVYYAIMNAAVSFNHVLNCKRNVNKKVKSIEKTNISFITETDKIKRSIAKWFLEDIHVRTMDDCKSGWYWDDHGIWVRFDDQQQQTIDCEYDEYNSNTLISRNKSLYKLGNKNAQIDFKNMDALSYDDNTRIKLKRKIE